METACTLALMRLGTDCMEMFFICCVGQLTPYLVVSQNAVQSVSLRARSFAALDEKYAVNMA